MKLLKSHIARDELRNKKQINLVTEINTNKEKKNYGHWKLWYFCYSALLKYRTLTPFIFLSMKYVNGMSWEEFKEKAKSATTTTNSKLHNFPVGEWLGFVYLSY